MVSGNFFFFLILSVKGIVGELFPQTGTSSHNDTTQIKVPQGVQIPFTGTLYKELFVSKDGLIGFNTNIRYNERNFSQLKYGNDEPFIAVFHFPAQRMASDIGSVRYEGQVLYDTIDNQDELANYSSIIEDSVVGVNSFVSTWALVVTWKDVISAKDVKAGCNLNQVSTSHCKTNTFQVVLLTDGNATFAIFNYIDIQTKVDGYIQVGFNIGYGRGFIVAINQEMLTNSKLNSTADKRHIFRIDEEKIVRGGCLRQNRGTLQIHPSWAGMFGGQMIDLSGPCLMSSDDVIDCRFAKKYVSRGYRVNMMKARCPVPLMNTRGWISIELSVNGENYQFGNEILIVHPSRMNDHLTLPNKGKGSEWNETSAQNLTLNWKSKMLSNNANATVKISLIGYQEIGNTISWKKVYDIGTTSVKSETFTFSSDKQMCTFHDCDYDVGFVKLELADIRESLRHSYVVSGVIAMGFYVGKARERQLGTNWSSKMCKTWYNEDKQDMSWLQELQHCPCNLVQALSDIGRWQTDAGCSLFSSSPNKCRFHIGAVHCVRAVQPIAKGSGNQCCYDKAGNLRYAADTFQGSTPDRSHDWGTYPYDKPDFVPSMSHWLKDVITFYYCCLWTGYDDCDYYMDQRATTDCAGYTPPVIGMVFGQGHIKTFEGVDHRICSEGDYIIMKTISSKDTVTVQGRFRKQLYTTNGKVANDSVTLTNLAVRVGDVETVEIRLKPPTADRRERQLDVLVNQKYYFFDEQPNHFQDFSKFAVVNSDTGARNVQSNFTIILHNGLGVQVGLQYNILTAVIVAPSLLKKNIQGLLGNPADDKSSTKLLWAVNDSMESIIPMNVVPHYNSTGHCSRVTPAHQVTECKDDKECLNLFTMTERYKELRSFVTPVRSCRLLDVPRSVKSSFNYKLNSTVVIEGCRIGKRKGGVYNYTCTSTGTSTQEWKPSVTATCLEKTKSTSGSNGLWYESRSLSPVFIISLLVLLLQHIY